MPCVIVSESKCPHIYAVLFSLCSSAALSGVVLYNYLKARDAKAALTLPTDAAPERKPLTAKVTRPVEYF